MITSLRDRVAEKMAEVVEEAIRNGLTLQTFRAICDEEWITGHEKALEHAKWEARQAWPR